MDTISPSLDEAAKVDGANDFQIFTKIIAPLARPILVVIFVITFIGIYSDYILAAIFLKDKNLWTVAVGINTVFVDDFNADWGQVIFFQPKSVFSHKAHCKMLALYKEGKGMAFVFFLFDKGTLELDRRFLALRFKEENVID